MDIVLTRILECMGNRYGAGKDLANHLGISGNVITNWKNGSNRSYLKHLREIAEFYNVSESYLLGKTDIKNRPPELDDMADILSALDCLYALGRIKFNKKGDKLHYVKNRQV